MTLPDLQEVKILHRKMFLPAEWLTESVCQHQWQILIRLGLDFILHFPFYSGNIQIQDLFFILFHPYNFPFPWTSSNPCFPGGVLGVRGQRDPVENIPTRSGSDPALVLHQVYPVGTQER